MSDYQFQIGDRIIHRNEPNRYYVVVGVDRLANLILDSVDSNRTRPACCSIHADVDRGYVLDTSRKRKAGMWERWDANLFGTATFSERIIIRRDVLSVASTAFIPNTSLSNMRRHYVIEVGEVESAKIIRISGELYYALVEAFGYEE